MSEKRMGFENYQGKNRFRKTRILGTSEMIDEIKEVENSKGFWTKKNKYRVVVLKNALKRRNTDNIINLKIKKV